MENQDFIKARDRLFKAVDSLKSLAAPADETARLADENRRLKARLAEAVRRLDLMIARAERLQGRPDNG